MYMPRLRARQHEVLAVRACAESLLTRSVVVPILEPVAAPNDLFVRRLRDIADAGLRCDLVINPSAGELKSPNQWRELATFYLDQGLVGPHDVAILSNASADHASMAHWVEQARRDGPGFSVDIVHEQDLSVTLAGSTYRDIRWNIAQDRTVPGSYGLPLSGKPVIWASDPFPGLERNRDYVGRDESIFTTRTMGYESAGYLGLSDFLTLGERFVAGGGPAYAVVIHITYERNGVVRLRHFCSDSNDSQDDPGGKFLEAVTKVADFIRAESIPLNLGLQGLLDLHSRGHFPGLGKVKELSMMNHMLLMHRLV